MNRPAITRRQFVGGAAIALAGCSRATAPPPPALDVALAELPQGRSRLMHRGRPVELLREGDVVVAFDLTCTHQGCVVAFVDELEIYRCPCHDGEYEADGTPRMGPPRRPLARLDVIEVGGRLSLGGGDV